MSEQQEAQGTYFFDAESTSEMVRLIEQDRTMTKAMGGPLAGLPALPPDAEIVDLACGPGGWVLDVAHASPNVEIAGVDVSRIMIDYANARAKSQDLTNASFGIMDITKPLDFPDHCFDLVNGRTLVGVLPQGAWQSFIAECNRILKPGGILRLVEPVDIGVTNSLATERILAGLIQAIWKRGYSFSIDGRTFGIVPVLPAFLREAGYQDVRTISFNIEFSAGTPAWIDFYHNYNISFQQSKPIILKTGTMTEEAFEQAYKQMLMDMNKPDFRGLATLVSIIGTKPA